LRGAGTENLLFRVYQTMIESLRATGGTSNVIKGRVEALAANRTGNGSAAHAVGSGHRAKNERAAVQYAVLPRPVRVRYST